MSSEKGHAALPGWSRRRCVPQRNRLIGAPMSRGRIRVFRYVFLVLKEAVPVVVTPPDVAFADTM